MLLLLAAAGACMFLVAAVVSLLVALRHNRNKNTGSNASNSGKTPPGPEDPGKTPAGPQDPGKTPAGVPVASGGVTAKEARAVAQGTFPKARLDVEFNEVVGPDGWTYLILTREKDPKLTLAKLVEMNRRMKLLQAEITRVWGAGDARVMHIAKMWAGPMSHVNQADLAAWFDPGAGAIGGGLWVWFGAPTDQTDPQNLDSLIHEVAHCLCEGPGCTCEQGPPCTCMYDGKCAPWMYGGHGPAWNTHQKDLREIAHRLGLRAFDASWNCAQQCGNLGG